MLMKWSELALRKPCNDIRFKSLCPFFYHTRETPLGPSDIALCMCFHNVPTQILNLRFRIGADALGTPIASGVSFHRRAVLCRPIACFTARSTMCSLLLIVKMSADKRHRSIRHLLQPLSVHVRNNSDFFVAAFLARRRQVFPCCEHARLIVR